jgi:hypothetical protein
MDGWWILVAVRVLLAIWGIAILALLRYCNAMFLDRHADGDSESVQPDEAPGAQSRPRSGPA